MKKLVFLVVILFIIGTSPSVYALDNINASEILPQSGVDILEENGIKSLDLEEILNLSPSECVNYLFKCIKNEIDTPFLMVYMIFLVIIITSVASAMGGGFLSAELEKSFSVVGVLCVCTTALIPLISCLDQTRSFIIDLSGFVEAFVPVFSAATVSSGQPITGAGYSVVVIFASEFLSVFLSDIILPLLFLYLSFSIAGRCVAGFRYEYIATSIKSVINWSLTLLMTMFVSLVTIKGLIGAGADSVALRTGRFFIGSFVPAVGGALSEAASTVQKSLGLIKNTTGVFGIIVAALCFIPPLIKVLIFKFTCDICAIAGEALGAEKIAGLLRDVSGVLGLLNSVILSYSALIVLSTTVSLIVGKG